MASSRYLPQNRMRKLDATSHDEARLRAGDTPGHREAWQVNLRKTLKLNQLETAVHGWQVCALSSH
jgi:hypothetical protein